MEYIYASRCDNLLLQAVGKERYVHLERMDKHHDVGVIYDEVSAALNGDTPPTFIDEDAKKPFKPVKYIMNGDGVERTATCTEV